MAEVVFMMKKVNDPLVQTAADGMPTIYRVYINIEKNYVGVSYANHIYSGCPKDDVLALIAQCVAVEYPRKEKGFFPIQNLRDCRFNIVPCSTNGEPSGYSVEYQRLTRVGDVWAKLCDSVRLFTYDLNDQIVWSEKQHIADSALDNTIPRNRNVDDTDDTDDVDANDIQVGFTISLIVGYLWKHERYLTLTSDFGYRVTSAAANRFVSVPILSPDADVIEEKDWDTPDDDIPDVDNPKWPQFEVTEEQAVPSSYTDSGRVARTLVRGQSGGGGDNAAATDGQN